MRDERLRGAAFVLALWFVTRAIIAVAVFVVAPTAAGASGITFGSGLWGGLERLSVFDGAWYARVATTGYQYVPNAGYFDVAFFPGYPALIWLLSRSGLPVNVAGLIVNNGAFLGALFVLYAWVHERWNAGAARWAVATLCCCPLSLFGSTAYSDGLFLLLSTLALREFDRKRYGAAAIWGALSSFVRFPAVALAPAFIAAAVAERRARIAWLSALAPLLGVLAFGWYCRVRFSDPLAFAHAQLAWRSFTGIDASAWRHLFRAAITAHWKLNLIALAAGLSLWFFRARLHALAATAIALVFVVALRLSWADIWPAIWSHAEYVILFTVVGGGAVVAAWRQLGPAPAIFALEGIAMIVLSGLPESAARFVYGFVPITIALALAFQRVPAIGAAVLAVMTYDLYDFAVHFARAYFVE